MSKFWTSIYVTSIAAGLLLGCTSTTNTPFPTGTPEDSAALCIQAITTSRKAATALLRAGKISLEKDIQIQDSLNLLVPGCRELVNEDLTRRKMSGALL